MGVSYAFKSNQKLEMLILTSLSKYHGFLNILLVFAGAVFGIQKGRFYSSQKSRV
jgi:hypothetical protein